MAKLVYRSKEDFENGELKNKDKVREPTYLFIPAAINKH